jgi:signal transduction histidine kinase
VAELVRVEVGEPGGAGLGRSTAEHLLDAGGGHATVASEPVVGQRRVGVGGAGALVAVERLHDLRAYRERPGTRTLSNHVQELVVEVYI